ncbi:MAG: arginase [Firmicutes bacterium]|jgi:arginase|uniref:Arginase n=1 Tax=Sulfobacillus benefaciens TaxID=453960 RepID=A0A2T2X7Z4_9FIRM|nr:arginase [Bacillota bacterium]MCL5014102.1 arginase [Bacillota bacterium]PSR30577.1 MAG: arginase [Sulfobacillus benefaciens]
MKLKTIRIIGVPLDYGADRRGVDMGPSAIRYAGLHEKIRQVGHQVIDIGNLPVPVPETRAQTHQGLKYADEIVRVSRVLARAVEKTLDDGQYPLVLGGDHSIAIGTISGLLRKFARVGLLWFDAHGDYNTDQTSPSGNVHGMPVATVVGLGHPVLKIPLQDRFVDPHKIVYVGVRTLDAEEAHRLRESGATVFSMHEIDRYGMHDVMAKAMDIVTDQTDAVHLSFDIDAVDPLYAPGSGTPYSGGLTEREAHLALELLAESDIVSSMEMVEVNPILDERNRTGKLAANLIASALGHRII